MFRIINFIFILLLFPLFVNASAVVLTPDGETDPVKSSFDAADDPAIWINKEDPSKSLLLGSDKQRGIEVYNLDGDNIRSHKLGNINNIDIRYDFRIQNETFDIIAGTNASSNTIDIFRLYPTGELTKLNGAPIKPKFGIYGFSLYLSNSTGNYYAFVTGHNGEVEQYRLLTSASKVIGRLIRNFKLSSKAEGMVVDDDLGNIYIAEESVGIWRFKAEPGKYYGAQKTDQGTLICSVKDGHLTPDVEGLTIYKAGDHQGYLLASSQGDNSYALYHRRGNNEYIGSFTMGTHETDGIEATNYNLGEKYPHGLLMVQDGTNKWPKHQNFKMISWTKIADAFGLLKGGDNNE